MHKFVLKLWYDEGSACTFYTISWLAGSDEEPSETDKFFDLYAVPAGPYYDEAMQLFRLIVESIGNKYGATNDFFDRLENNAQALPPKPKQRVEEIKNLGFNFPLRLFCYFISEKVVVLLNGGLKEAKTVQESEDLRFKFNEAQALVKKIAAALQEKIIEVTDDQRYLQNFDGSNEIIL